MGNQSDLQTQKLVAALQVRDACVRIAAAQQASFRLVVRSVRNISVKDFEDVNQGQTGLSGDFWLKGDLLIRPKGTNWDATFPVKHQVSVTEHYRSGDVSFSVSGGGPVAHLLEMALHDQDTEGTIRKHLGKVPFVPFDARYAASQPGVSIGDVFVNSWGYDQTNIDFYQVVKITPAMVTIRQVDKKTVKSTPHADYVVPKPGVFKGLPMRKKVQEYQGQALLKINGYSVAKPWDGKPRFQTGLMAGH